MSIQTALMQGKTYEIENDAPMTDACCTRLGWIEYLISNHLGCELHISVPADADLDGYVHSFWHDDQEMLWVIGHVWDWEKIEEVA